MNPQLEIGKLPPQALELEDAVLGAILLEQDALNVVAGLLKPEMFYKIQNQKVYEAVISLSKKQQPFDILTVTQELKARNDLEIVGGAYYVSSLTNRIASTANIEFHARIVSQKFLQREMIRICTATIKNAYEEGADVFELKDSVISKILDITNFISNQKRFDTIENTGDEYMQQLDDTMSGRKPASILTGIAELDEYGILLKSSLITVGARPGMGKTSFIVTLARNIAVKQNIPVGLFSLEMSTLQLINKIASAECQIDSEDLTKGTISKDEFVRVNSKIIELAKTPLYIDQTTNSDIHELCCKAKIMVAKHGIELLIVDYLNLIDTKRFQGNVVASVSYISKTLKVLAKELNIPVIDLAQLSRKIEERPIYLRFPLLSDLRDSGAIEQDSDVIVFLFRPQYYHIDCDKTEVTDNKGNTTTSYFFNPKPKDENSQSINVTNKCFLEIAKNRHGKLGIMTLGFAKEITEFYSLRNEPLQINDYTVSQLEQNNNFLN